MSFRLCTKSPRNLVCRGKFDLGGVINAYQGSASTPAACIAMRRARRTTANER